MPFPSPNFGERRGGLRPSLVVLHYTAMASCAEARDRLCDPTAEVSAHWLIDRDGRAEQLVDEAARAWHAGAGAWGGHQDVNSRSIGIELQNTGADPFAEPQMAALERLLADVLARWDIPPQGVIGHSDMAPLRKGDPGRGSTGGGWRCRACRSGRSRAAGAQGSAPTCSASAIPMRRTKRCCAPSGCASAPGRRGRRTPPTPPLPPTWPRAFPLTGPGPRLNPLSARMAG